MQSATDNLVDVNKEWSLNGEKKIGFVFSCPKDHSTQKLGSKVKSCVLYLVNRQTYRQTEMKVNTEGILSEFQDFFLQPIIKDWPNKKIKKFLTSICKAFKCVLL